MRLYTYEVVSGVANQEVGGTGITSTQEEPKRIIGVYVIVSARAGNIVKLAVEREDIAEIHDDFLPTNTDFPKPFIELDLELPVGETLKPFIKSGATATNITVIYVYELARA